MAPPNKKLDPFDLSKLMQMGDQITLWVERINGSQNEAITLPALGHNRGIDPAATPGSGWTRDDVAKLIPWLRDHWTGAGAYRVQAVDAQNKTLEWEVHIPMDEKTKQRPAPALNQPGLVPPSAMQLVPVQIAPPQPPQPQPGAQPWGAQPISPGWAPPPPVVQPPQQGMQGWQGGQGAWQAPQQQPWTPWQQPPQQPQQWGPYGPIPPQQYGGAQPWQQPQVLWPPAKAGDANELRMKELEDRLNKSERDKLELKYQQENERNKIEHQRQLDAMKEEIRRGNESRNSGDSEALIREREARERAERDARETRDRAEREAERARNDTKFGELAAMIAKMAEGNPRRSEDDERWRRQEEENRRRDEEHRRELEKRDLAARDEKMRLDMLERDRRHEEALRRVEENAKRGPDPVLEMMKENSRNQIESSRQMAQLQQAQITAMTQNAINPLQLVSIMKDRDGMSDQFMRSLLPTMTGMLDMFRTSTEQIIGMAGGGPSAAWQPVAEQALQTGKEVMDRYFSWKRDADVSGNKAKIAHAEAQAQAAQAAARAQEAVRDMNRPAPATPPPAAAAPAAAAPAPRPGAPDTPNPAVQQPPAAPRPGAPDPAGGQVIPLKQKPTQEAMFGPTLKDVERLRLGVKEGKLNPAQAVDAILKGINFIEAHNMQQVQKGEPPLVIPAFTLYADKRWADFADVLLPNAPQPFRDEIARILNEEIEAVDQNGNPIPQGAGAAPADPDLKV